MELINSIIGFVIAIGILVTFHEYGHFIVARMCNVKVLKFSVGFGKPILSTVSRKSKTEYSLGMIPLGGYVQMLESNNPNDDSTSVKEEDYQYCFDKKNVYQRFAIVAAGPIFNLILAVAFFTLTYMNGIGGIKPKIELSNDTYQIVSVNDNKVDRWQDVRVELLNNIVNKDNINLQLMNSENKKIDYQLKYNSSILNKEGDVVQNIGLDIVYPNSLPIIGKVDLQDNNENIQVGDKILSINNHIVESWHGLVEFIQKNPETKINIVAERDSTVVEYSAKVLSRDGKGFLGISKQFDDSNFILVNYSFYESLKRAASSTSDYTLLTFKMIGRLITGDANMKNLSGPLSIAQFSGKSLEMGLSYFIFTSNT